MRSEPDERAREEPTDEELEIVFGEIRAATVGREKVRILLVL